MSDLTRFFVTGGTLALDAPSYVERQADTILLRGLIRGDFCYVLTPRQMGKSSLMVRTAAKLREQGTTVAILDLTMVGQLLTQEQWYYGLLLALGGQVGLRNPLKEFWLENKLLGPLQRWMAALREVVLPSLGHPGGPAAQRGALRADASAEKAEDTAEAPRLVIFVDEIDAVRSLPFSTDELFAAIRECYNRRPHDPEMYRLTFCLVGVATPSDLIQDPRTTPFNIGVRVELEDFTDTEALPLTAGLVVGRAESLGRTPAEAREILRRILYWTSGHPYLTQQLCQAMVDTPTERGVPGVDRVCEELFLAPGARERDDNLILVRERLLRTGDDLGGILELYSRVWQGRRVKDDALQPSIVTLRLSGIVKAVERRLVVRNRIYERAFDREWIRAVMPGGEVRRQQAAYRQGMLRAAAMLCAILIALLASFLGFQQFKRAEQREHSLRQNRYETDIDIAEKAIRSGELRRARELLDLYLPRPGKEDLRGFEWHYLRTLAEQDHRIAELEKTSVQRLVYLPDGRTVLGTSAPYPVTYFNDLTGQVTRSHPRPPHLFEVAKANPHFTLLNPEISADGRWMSRCFGARQAETPDRGHWTVEVVEVGKERGTTICEFPGWPGGAPALSPDGRLLALCRREASRPRNKPAVLELWNVRLRKRITTLTLPEPQNRNPHFSPDGKQLALSAAGGLERIWRVTPTGLAPLPQVLSGHLPQATVHQFSGDGKLLAVGTGTPHGQGEKPGQVMLWDVERSRLVGILAGHNASVSALAFSRDGRTLVSGGRDHAVKVWDLQRRTEQGGLEGIPGWINAICISPDARRLVVAESPARVHFLELSGLTAPGIERPFTDSISSTAFVDERFGKWQHRLPFGHRWTERSRLLVAKSGLPYSRASIVSPITGRVARLRNKEIEITDLASGQKRSFSIIPQMGRTPEFSADGRQILICDRRGNIFAIDAESGVRREVMRLGSPAATLATGSTDIIAAISAAGQLQVSIGGQPPAVVRRRGAYPPLSVSRDGKRVSFVDADGVVVHNLATQQEIRCSVLANEALGTQVATAICPDNRTIAISVPQERAVRLHSLRTGVELARVRPLPAEAKSLNFSSDGSKLAIGCGDGSVVLVPPTP